MHIKKITISDGTTERDIDFEKLHRLLSKCKVCGCNRILLGAQDSRLSYLSIECADCGTGYNVPFEFIELEAEDLEDEIINMQLKNVFSRN